METTAPPTGYPSLASPEALEQAVLGAILWDAQDTGGAQVAEEVGRLGLDDFADPKHREVFRAMIDLTADGQALLVEDVTSRLTTTGRLEMAGDVLYVTGLLHTVFGSAQFAFHCQRLREATAVRFMEAAAAMCLDVAKGPREHFYGGAAAAIRVMEAARDRGPAEGLAALRTVKRR